MTDNKNFMKHYKRAQAMRRGFVLFDLDTYEIHVKSAYAYVEYAHMLDSEDVKIRNTIRMYKELVDNYMAM